MKLYVGTFSHSNENALYVFDYDQPSGRIAPRSISRAVVNPAFLALHPTRNFLYAVSEVSGGKGGPQPPGQLAAFELNPPGGGDLRLVNQRPAMGPRPCHISVDSTGRLLFVANYRGASFAMFPIEADGAIGPAAAQIHHEGSSIDPGRQAGSHPHSCLIDPTNRWLYVADLGIDKVVQYDVDFNSRLLEPHDPPSVAVRPGSGPRHLVFHPNGFLYVTNEMGGTVTAFAVEPTTGTPREIQTISTLPEGYEGLRWNSHIAIAPSGRFLYAGNRGHDSIAIFALDPTDGRLTPVGHQMTYGKTPRHFAFDPAGRRLIVGNQDSASLVVFDADTTSGTLTRIGEYAGITNPVCLLFDARPISG